MSNSAILSITLEKRVATPLYVQLQQQIEALIVAKRVAMDAKIPSSRELAKNLGISRTSTLRALDTLVAEGVLIAKPKRGLYVAKNQRLLLQNTRKQQSAPLHKEINTAPQAMLFSSGSDVTAFPTKRWAKCMQAGWQNASKPMLEGHYDSGLPALKVQVSKYLHALRGLQSEPNQIVITAGNRDSLTIISHALSHRKVWLESPCYPPVVSLFNLLTQPIHALKVDAHGACIPNIPEGLAVLTPCRQYPTGSPMSSLRRQAWLELLAQKAPSAAPLYVIEDDYDNEYVFKGRASVPLMQQDSSSCVLFVGSFSKVLFRGLRLSFIVCPPPLVANIQASQKALGISSTTAMQPALTEFMASGFFTSHLRKMQRLYASKRAALLASLVELSAFLNIDTRKGGMHVCAYLKPMYSHLESTIVNTAKQRSLVLNTMSSHYFHTHENCQPKMYGFVLGFTQPTLEEIAKYSRVFAAVIVEVCTHTKP